MSDTPNYTETGIADIDPITAQPLPSRVETAIARLPQLGNVGMVNLGTIAASPFTGGRAAQGTPIITRMPDYRAALTNKYTKLAPQIAALPEHIRKALIDYDTNKVDKGSAPLTEQQTLNVIQTALTNKLATPKPDRDIWDLPGNLVSDLGGILKSIPRIPGALIKEATDIPKFASVVAENAEQGMNPVAALLNAPGIRMLPGAYIAGNLAQGKVGELARHPLYTGLDLLPAAQSAAKLTPVVKAATEEAAALGRSVNPLRTLATRTLDEAGEIVPNRLGEATNAFRDSTRPGQILDSMFGSRNREIAREANRLSFDAHAKMIGLEDTGSPLLATIRQGVELNAKYEAMAPGTFTPARKAEIAKAAQLDRLDGLSDIEIAYVNEAKSTAIAFGEHMVDAGEMGKVLDPRNGNTEFYDTTTAAKINDARVNHQRATRINRNVKDYLDPQPGRVTHDEWMSRVDEALNQPDNPMKIVEARSLIHGMTAHGYDMTAAKKALTRVTSGKAQWEEFTGAIPATPTTRHYSMSEIAKELSPYRKDPTVSKLIAAIKDGNTKRITQEFNNLRNRSTYALAAFDNPEFKAAITNTRDALAFHNTQGRRFSDRAVARAERRGAKLYAENAPARFGPAITERTNTRVLDKVLSRSATPDEAARLTTAVLQRNWKVADTLTGSQAGFTADLAKSIERDVARTWQILRDEGIDPVFVHSTSASRARAAARPKIGAVANSLSQTRERALDFSPGVNDMGVSLTHQGAEVLTRLGSEEFFDFVGKGYGKSEADLRALYAERAARDAARNPVLDFDGHLQEYMRRDYEVFNPDTQGYSWGGAKLDKYRQDQIWVPKSIAANLRKMNDPSAILNGIVDPISKTFRVSVIGLSPRTQLNNVLGGAVMLMGQTGPGVTKFFREAVDLVKHPERIDNPTMRAVIGTQEAVMKDLNDLSTSKYGQLAVDKWNYAKGKMLGRLFQESRDAGKASAFTRGVEKSMELNGFLDDVYRMMSYKYGEAKGLAKGMDTETAYRAGEELARKTMMDYTSMTPFERSIMKSIIPFYGFTAHALKYVFRYPVDHPYRAEMLAKFAQSEEEDLGALPTNFLASLFIGSPNSKGQQNAINIGSMNPFGDTANSLTLAGFLASTNPIMQTVLEAVGVQRGEGELYPSLRYDAESGRLAGEHSNPLLGFVENVIPQTSIVTAMLGLNEDYADMVRTNPAAAFRSLTGAVGLPTVMRQYNVPQEQFKNELAVEKSAASVKGEALKSGDWSDAMRYPSLRAYFDQVSNLTPEQLANFQSPGNTALREQVETLLAANQGVPPRAAGGGV